MPGRLGQQCTFLGFRSIGIDAYEGGGTIFTQATHGYLRSRRHAIQHQRTEHQPQPGLPRRYHDSPNPPQLTFLAVVAIATWNKHCFCIGFFSLHKFTTQRAHLHAFSFSFRLGTVCFHGFPYSLSCYCDWRKLQSPQHQKRQSKALLLDKEWSGIRMTTSKVARTHSSARQLLLS